MCHVQHDICICHSLSGLCIGESDNAIASCVVVFLQQKFLQLLFIPRHVNPENVMQIDQRLLEL